MYPNQNMFLISLASTALIDSKFTSTLVEANTYLTPMDSTLSDNSTQYHCLVHSLIYLTITQPNIAYLVHIISQIMGAPHSTHYVAILRIFHYVKGTLFHGLHFSAHQSLELYPYSDAVQVGDPTDHHSIFGFCFFLGDSLITQHSKKQSVTVCSSFEAEYRVLAYTSQELVWLHWLLKDMGVTHSSPITIHCDNQSAIEIAHSDVFHERTQHLEIDCHFVRQYLIHGILNLCSVCSLDQIAYL